MKETIKRETFLGTSNVSNWKVGFSFLVVSFIIKEGSLSWKNVFLGIFFWEIEEFRRNLVCLVVWGFVDVD